MNEWELSVDFLLLKYRFNLWGSNEIQRIISTFLYQLRLALSLSIQPILETVP